MGNLRYSESLWYKLGLTFLILGTLSLLFLYAFSWSSGPMHFQKGHPKINNNSQGMPMYQIPNPIPGMRIQRCMKITFKGNGAANVRFYTNTTSAATKINPELVITPGKQSQVLFPSCSDFVPTGKSIYRGTLVDFSATHNEYGNGLSVTPVGQDVWQTNDAVVYRFTFTLPQRLPKLTKDDPSHAYTFEARIY